MLAKTSSPNIVRRCSKCNTLTDCLGTDPVTGTVAIPLCPRCARSAIGRLVILVAVLGTAAAIWMM